jgi:hypothetical protein
VSPLRGVERRRIPSLRGLVPPPPRHHAASSTNPTPWYDGTLELGMATFNIARQTLTTRAYRQAGGSYSIPGPTIKMTPGNKYVLHFRNTLPYQALSTQMNVYKDPNVSNVHTHGLHISGESPSDDVTRWFEGQRGGEKHNIRKFAPIRRDRGQRSDGCRCRPAQMGGSTGSLGVRASSLVKIRSSGVTSTRPSVGLRGAIRFACRGGGWGAAGRCVLLVRGWGATGTGEQRTTSGIGCRCCLFEATSSIRAT